MNIVVHQRGSQRIAEIQEEDVVVFASAADAFDLLVNLSYENDVTKFIVNHTNVAADFFVLRTGMAGDLMQKLVNYKMQLAIVGDFRKVASESLKAFIVECNRGHQVFFVGSVAAAKDILFERELP